MAASTKKSIRYYVTRRVVRNWLVSMCVIAAIVLVAAFQVAGESADRIAMAQARLVAAGMTPGSGGDLLDSVMRTRRACDDVIAVATVGTTGELLSIYPNRAGHRAAMTEAVDRLRDGLHLSLGDPVSVTSQMASPTQGKNQRLTAVAVPLNGEDAPGSLSIVVLLAKPAGVSALNLAVALFGSIALVLMIGAASLQQRLDYLVCRPLRRLSKAFAATASAEGRRQRCAAATWRELEEIGESFEGLLKQETAVQARFERLRVDTDERLKNREAGLDRRLRRAEDKAMTDPMTRLRNRAYLEANLETLFEKQRDGGNLCAIMLDLDNFKQHNDRYGHQSGDAMIVFAGSLLSGSIRADDVAIRYGGDEFLMLLPDIGEQQAAAIIDRIVKMFGQYARQVGEAPFVTMSAGISSLKLDMPKSGEDLVAKADRALYRVKSDGKNAVAMFSAA